MTSRIRSFVFGIVLLSLFGIVGAAKALTLTSITIDPEEQYGSTTNAPGAWTTNTLIPCLKSGSRRQMECSSTKGLNPAPG